VSPVVTVLPFNEADSVALTVAVVELAVAVKPPLDCPWATVTLEGTVTIVLLLDSDTEVPPDGADPLRFTVHVAVPGPVTVPGAQLTPTTCNGACVDESVSPVVTVLPFNEAESVALIVVVVELAVAVKPPLD
jgi:hypothetical protein